MLPIGEVLCGDCLDVMRGWPAGCIDAVITDPPYGLSFMGKKWDYQVPSVEIWREVYRVLKDGGRLLAFSGARTQHRMVCNIEDAGFTIEDCMMWLYGSGFPKHGSKLKPAFEPICVARKGKVSLLNIDDARIETTDDLSHDGGGIQRLNKDLQAQGYRPSDYAKPKEERESPAGRWPANVCMDEAAAVMLDEQSGIMPGKVGMKKHGSGTNSVYGAFARSEQSFDKSGESDSGGASRFFKTCEPDTPTRFLYQSKASASERNSGLSGMPLHPGGQRSNTSGQHITRRDGGDPAPVANHHPTVKPLALMRWLVRLATFPGEIVLDPFAGSGTTLIACQREGRPCIGIELNAEYAAIARKRTAQKGLDFE